MNGDVTFIPTLHPWNKIPGSTHLDFTETGSAAWIMDPSPDQLDFFHKLGYSTAQVQAVLRKFGLTTDTDKVLGELVRTGAGPETKQGQQRPVTTMSVLVPRGDIKAAPPALLLPITAISPPSREDESSEDGDALRPVVIDGSNVAMSHGNKEVFSCLGIQLAVNFFLERGHADITVFVPSWRKEQPRPDVPITDQHILRDLEKKKILVFTPSRRVAGKRVVCHDDRFIVKLAYESDGIIVSNDTYRDLQGEKPEWKRFIEERLLMYSFVNNKFMLPDDPLGRHGPTLENFLRMFPKICKKQLCPYGKKCTYGIKCKFHHPERANQSHRSLADELREKAKHPSTTHKQSSASPSPGPVQSFLLVKEMAQKLTLEEGNGYLKKEHTNENLVLVKGSHRASKRTPLRKEKTSQHSRSDLESVQHCGSQEQLDSGLGSIDNQPVEAPWSHGGSRQPTHSLRQQYCPSRSTPCSCCSHAPPSLGTTPGFQHQNQHHNMAPTCSHSSDEISYGLPHYHSYGAYPFSVPAYNQLADFQHSGLHGCRQPYWSDPFGVHPQVVHSMSGEHSHWEPPQGTQPNPQREVVRKKLLAIFNAHLVDMAMGMFPQLMDPQMLAAEILKLQSQSLR